MAYQNFQVIMRQKVAAKKQEEAAKQNAQSSPSPAYVEPPVKQDNSAMLRRYDALRGRARADVAQQTGEEQDALQRRFAQLGNLSSGASMKQQQLTNERGAQLQQRATEGIDIAQSQEQAQLDETTRGREFARQERVGSQAFASGERRASQEFAAGESAASRGQADRQFQASLAFEENKFGQQMTQQIRMNDLEAKVQQFNMDAYEAEMNKKSMIDRLGDLGTGGWKGLKNGTGGSSFIKSSAGSAIGGMTPFGPVAGAAGGLFG